MNFVGLNVVDFLQRRWVLVNGGAIDTCQKDAERQQENQDDQHTDKEPSHAGFSVIGWGTRRVSSE